MTPSRRIAKLEAQVESLRKRLDARTIQLILVLDQFAEVKAQLAEHGLELELKPVEVEPCQPDEATASAKTTAEP